MALIKSDESKKFPPLEEGAFPAYVVQVIDLGMQEQTDFQTGESKGEKPSVLFTFELPTETIEIDGEDKPRWLSKQLTYSVSKGGSFYIHEKSGLAALIKATGNATGDFKKDGFFDVRKLIGCSCLLNVGMTSGGKNKVVSFAKLPKGFPKLPPIKNNTVVFDLDDPDMEVFQTFPKFIQDKIGLGTDKNTGSDEELPF